MPPGCKCPAVQPGMATDDDNLFAKLARWIFEQVLGGVADNPAPRDNQFVTMRNAMYELALASAEVSGDFCWQRCTPREGSGAVITRGTEFACTADDANAAVFYCDGCCESAGNITMPACDASRCSAGLLSCSSCSFIAPPDPPPPPAFPPPAPTDLSMEIAVIAGVPS